jgi:hypothetical protein
MATPMTKEERRWCLLYAAALVLLTAVPYLIAYFAQGDAWRFSGFVFGVEDGNSYIAKMLSGAWGSWLFRTPYTTDPQRGVIAFLPYILLGKVAEGEALHEQLVALFHLFRSGAILLEVWAVYRFASIFLPQASWRRWATVLATAGGGLGWVLVILGQETWLGSLPLDLHSPETFGFLAVYGLPHLVLARGLLLIGLVHYLESHAAPHKGWLAGILWLALGLVQPLTVATGYAVVAAHLMLVALRSRRGEGLAELKPWLASAARTVVVSSPMMIYNTIAFTSDPYLRAWASQNRIPSPLPPHYIVAYGLVLVPAAWAAWRMARSRSAVGLLLVGWMLALPVLAYAPVNVQRRLPDGIWVALAVLAALACREWNAAAKPARLLGPAILLASLPSSLILLAGGVRASLHPEEPVFIPRAEAAAFEWLRDHGEAGAAVASAYETANALPAWAPMRVVAGHGPETPSLAVVLPQVERLFQSASGDRYRDEFIAQHDIGYVFIGPHEAALGDWRPAAGSRYQRVYHESGYSIYQVED